MSGFLNDLIRRNLDRDPGDAPAVDLLTLLDDYSWVDSGSGPSGPGWSPPRPPEPPLMRTRDLIHGVRLS